MRYSGLHKDVLYYQYTKRDTWHRLYVEGAKNDMTENRYQNGYECTLQKCAILWDAYTTAFLLYTQVHSITAPLMSFVSNLLYQAEQQGNHVIVHSGTTVQTGLHIKIQLEKDGRANGTLNFASSEVSVHCVSNGIISMYTVQNWWRNKSVGDCSLFLSGWTNGLLLSPNIKMMRAGTSLGLF